MAIDFCCSTISGFFFDERTCDIVRNTLMNMDEMCDWIEVSKFNSYSQLSTPNSSQKSNWKLI
jgi:hypothetical protein